MIGSYGAWRRSVARSAGFSLLELLIALALGMVVLLGILQLLNQIGIVNRTQDGMARMQENGRYALQRIATDLRAGSNQYCSSFQMSSSSLGPGATKYVDSGRPFISLFNAAGAPLAPNWSFGPPGNVAAYTIDPRFMLFGNDCGTACTPSVVAADRGIHLNLNNTIGSANGNRATGGDVITMRTLDAPGARITGINAPGGGTPAQISFDPAEAPRLGIGPGTDALMFANCSSAILARVTSLTPNTAQLAFNFDNGAFPRLDFDRQESRAFNLASDFSVVSYFLQIKADPNTPGRQISSLWRRLNNNAQELVEGVERLDFLYGVEDGSGQTSFLSAAEVDASLNCPAPVVAGCGWRSVKSVEVFMLLNTVNDVVVNNDEPFRYSFLNSGAANAAGAFENPATLGTTRNGLPAGRMLRREFRALVSLRGYNF